MPVQDLFVPATSTHFYDIGLFNSRYLTHLGVDETEIPVGDSIVFIITWLLLLGVPILPIVLLAKDNLPRRSLGFALVFYGLMAAIALPPLIFGAEEAKGDFPQMVIVATSALLVGIGIVLLAFNNTPAETKWVDERRTKRRIADEKRKSDIQKSRALIAGVPEPAPATAEQREKLARLPRGTFTAPPPN